VLLGRPGGNGGAFNIQGAFAGFSGVFVLGNTAARGGGIYVENGSVNLTNNTDVLSNTATVTGGGMFLNSASANLGPDSDVLVNMPNDIRCVMSSFNGGNVGTSSCLNCGACTTP
jgi:predicted outer membrane repeat protein